MEIGKLIKNLEQMNNEKSKYNYTEDEKKEILKRFMQEFFSPFQGYVEIGFFTQEMKDDYEAQAAKVCQYFGYDSVYEYGAETIVCHISYANRKPNKPFVTEIKSIYE